jgi:signal transduction histidine kinase
MPVVARLIPTNIFALSADQVVATARLALAAFGLAAIYLDPSQPAYHVEVAYGILVAYLVFALLLAFGSFFLPSLPAVQAVAYSIDIVTFSLVMRFTEGPTSPFFVLFTFALLSATLYWGWRGAIGTAVLLVLMLLLVTWSEGSIFAREDMKLDDLIIRGSYLVVTGVLLAYVGAYRDRARAGLAKLAAWPAEQTSLSELPPLGRSLAHAADVLRASRVLVLWEDAEEPYVYATLWTNGRPHGERLASVGLDELLAPEMAPHAFLMTDAAAPYVVSAEGPRSLKQSPISPTVLERFCIAGSVATAPFQGSGFSGRIFVVAPAFLGDDVLPLVEIAALRIGIEIEHHRLRIELQRAAAAEERMRIARDVHDGTLQALTAAALRLKNASETAPSDQRGRLDEIRQILSAQQQQLRSFVTEALQRWPRAEPVALKGELGQILRDIERDWNCATALNVEPESAAVDGDLQLQLRLLITEAAANAVRHGQARQIGVAVTRKSTTLSLNIRNDGRPLAGLEGQFDQHELVRRNAGPVSIRNRVAALHGQMMLSSSESGVELAIELPLA